MSRTLDNRAGRHRGARAAGSPAGSSLRAAAGRIAAIAGADAVRSRAAAAAARAALEGRATSAPPESPGRPSLRFARPAAESLWRLAAHLLLALIALGAIAVPQPVPRPAAPPTVAEDSGAAPSTIPPAASAQPPAEALFVPEGRLVDIAAADAFATYHTVAEGETLGDIARRYGVSVASIFWSNGLAEGSLLAVGQELRVPRVSGVPYVVQDGDTLVSIAAQFGIEPEAITLFKPNAVAGDSDLEVGRELFLPGAAPPYPQEVLARVGGANGVAQIRGVVAGSVFEDETNMRSGPGRAYPSVVKLRGGVRLRPLARHDDWVKVDTDDGTTGWVRADLIALSQSSVDALPVTNDFPPPPPRWVWPTYGELTSPFGWRTVPFRSFHDGLDIANRAGTVIVAARAGRVYEAGWCSGFGYCVKIDHGGGVVTIYGHMLRKPGVSAGQLVEAGDRIGLMGSTYDRAGGGYSTGVHLHFTVKVNGKPVNPMKYLP